MLQPGAQYTQKPGRFSPGEPQQGGDSKQVDDLGLDLSKQGKRWFPFSDGPRNCVGQALAKMNLAATFAQLYSHYSFKLAEEVTTTPTMPDPHCSMVQLVQCGLTAQWAILSSFCWFACLMCLSGCWPGLAS